MNRVGLTATAAIVSAATWMSFTYDVEASEWGCEALLCASSSNTVLARRAGVSPSDVSADLCDEGLGVFVAHLPRSRNRQTRP